MGGQSSATTVKRVVNQPQQPSTGWSISHNNNQMRDQLVTSTIKWLINQPQFKERLAVSRGNMLENG